MLASADIRNVFRGKFAWLALPWVVLPVVLTLVKYNLGRAAYNNYLLYTHVFHHIRAETNLYAFYPGEYLYQNHYGPSFSVLIAPFALLPDVVGMVGWALANALMLGYAILRLPMSARARRWVLAIVLIEMSGAIQNQQFNPMLTAWVLLSFICICEGKLLAAAFLVAGGALVKLYGVLGLLFTPFSGRYRAMALSVGAATAVLVCLPMLYSDPEFILRSYQDWYLRILGKNSENIRTNLTDGMQDLSAMGMIRRMTGWVGMSNAWVLVPAALLMLAPCWQRDRHADPAFRLCYLSQVLIGMVIFSTSSESPTYVIAVTGFAIWYANSPAPTTWQLVLLALLILLTILSPTDVFPKTIKKQWVNRYALKALPCVLAWIAITYDLLMKPSPPHESQPHVPASAAART